MKRAITTVLKLGSTPLLFALLFWPEYFGLKPDQFGAIKPWDMWHEIQRAGVGNILFWLSLGLVIKLAGMLCGVLRWRILLHGQGLRMPFWYMTGTWFVGRTFGIFLPGTTGLDGYRLYDSARYTGEVIKCATVIAVEKLIGFIALTSLVFFTFPLGFRLLKMNVPVLAAILFVLGSAVVFFLLLLLNPRIIQIIVAVLPAPASVRHKFDKLGASAAAYSGSRLDLLLAVLLGILVHAATCLLFFCTMTAIRTSNTSLLDILFASPLMIYGTVIGPSIGGEGIREIIFVTLLGSKSGAAAAATFAHLGWWVGDVIPFLIGLPIYVARRRPEKAELQAELAEARIRTAAMEAKVLVHLTPEQISFYRARTCRFIAAGAIAGLIAGALIGLGEAAWLAATLTQLSELKLLWWGPAIYALLFAAVGLGVAGGLYFLCLLADRFLPWLAVAALSFCGALSTGALVIGLWRYQRDILEGHVVQMAKLAPVAGALFGAALMGTLLFVIAGRILDWIAKGRAVPLIGGGVGVWLALVAAGGVASLVFAPDNAKPVFEPKAGIAKPNILFLGIDTLRADALQIYQPGATAKTPNLDAFAKDAVVFEQAVAQASWTKPSFATLFTGLYPSQHTATSKTAAIPEEVETLAERLRDAGYYTEGFANNPNVFSMFGFGQGFVEYTDLRPRLLFYASPSVARLSMYEVLRKARQRLLGKIPILGKKLGKMVVTDFYQPAEVITHTGLDWLDHRPFPDQAPFFLFLHYMDPHDPFMDPDAPGGGFARARMERPEPSIEAPMRKAYDLEIEHLDAHLGALFDGLKQRGLYQDTVIVFVSDHGEEFHEHNGWWHGFTLYQEMLRIPLIVKLPGLAQGGTRNADLARHVDVTPTLLHLAGLEKSPQMTGQILYDPATGFTNGSTDYAYAENDFEGNVLRAVQSKTEKTIETEETSEDRLAPVEFYDLAQDPAEKNNLAADAAHQEPLQALRKTIADYQDTIEQNAAEPQRAGKVDAATEDQLNAIGYLGDSKPSPPEGEAKE